MATVGYCKHGVEVTVDCWECYADGIKLEDGKYHFYYKEDTHTLYALRYGERWRSFVGDNGVRMLFFAAVDAQRRANERM
jgi:hypothetical protein